MSRFLFENGMTVEDLDDDWAPAWVHENNEDLGGGDVEDDDHEEQPDPEESLQFEEISAEDEDPIHPLMEDIEWIGDADYFFPETPDFEEPSSFIADQSITGDSTPFELLQKFLNPLIITEILAQTNLYAGQKNIPNWKSLTEKEFWRFLALNLLTGVVKKKNLQDYWSRDPLQATSYVNDTMSRNRFLQLLRGLHFVDLEDPTLNTTDRFHKMGIILPELLKNFRRLVNPGEFLTLDEELMPYKGALSIKQYNPKKRARFGVKSFFLMDCEHRYVLDILPYQGKSTAIFDSTWIKKFGFGGAAVLTMLRKGYLGKNHRVVVDNYFQSPILAKTLVRKDTFVLGTVRKDRLYMPKFPIRLNKGEVETCSDGDLLLERWMDNREVFMLNSFIEHRMEDSDTKNPKTAKIKPASVLVYNKSMGALDDMDKIIRPYQALRKSRKWYRKYAFHLFDICVYNAWVVYRHKNPQKKTGYKLFVLDLIKEIMDVNPFQRSTKGRPPLRQVQQTAHSSHYPSTHRNEKGKKNRGNCHWCWKKLNRKRKATTFRCKECAVWLCVDGENSCFQKYHENAQYFGNLQRRHPQDQSD